MNTKLSTFCEAFILHPHTEKLIILSDYQKQIIDSEHRRNEIKSHRRSGSTDAVVLKAIFKIIINPKSKVVILTPSLCQSEEIKLILKDFLVANKFINADVVKQISILNLNNPDRLRGMTGDHFFLEYAEGFSTQHWKAILPLLYGDTTRRGKICYDIFHIDKLEHPIEFDHCIHNPLPESEWDRLLKHYYLDKDSFRSFLKEYLLIN